MRILYDGSIYRTQVTGGVNRYFADLIAQLPVDVTPVLTAACRPDVPLPHHASRQLHWRRSRRWPRAVARSIERRHFRRLYGDLHVDLLHPTYYRLLSGEPLGRSRVPVVLTVYDMIHERFPEWIDPTGKHAEMKRRAILSAQAIICISHSTKNDLLERLPVPESRITVTYLASDLDPALAEGSEPVPPGPYFVYVGSRARYKNFDRLLAAMGNVSAAGREGRLCVVGAPFSRSEKRRIASLGLSDRVLNYGYASDGHLVRLYQQSVALVYPSMYEGFGIPPLEAMQCGTVVVAADCSSIPEVVGNAAVLFDPDRTDQLTDILLELLRNPGQRERYVFRGYRRAAQFNWQRTAAETFRVYRTLVENEVAAPFVSRPNDRREVPCPTNSLS